MKIIWSDFNENSPTAMMMRDAKAVNGPEFWPTMRKVFAHDVATLPFPRFRTWASVQCVPLVEQNPCARFLGAAFHGAYNNETISKALKENWAGVPDGTRDSFRLVHDFDTSAQRVQNVAHLVISGFTPERLQAMKSIVEIGGGYGDMCSVVHEMGFSGDYYIFDFPEVQAIQGYYLEKNKIKPKFVVDPADLPLAPDMVIGTWSLSEVPIDDRPSIMKRIGKAKNWLIVYQSKIFHSEVNDAWFRKEFPKAEYILLRDTDYDGKNYYMIVKEQNND